MNDTIPSQPPLTGRTVSGPVSARIRIDGCEYINFFGAGYLALSGLPEIREAVLRAFHDGVPFARHVSALHGAIDAQFDAVEREAARACGTTASVYFASGYLIGAACLASFEEAFDVVLIDECAHYSLQDAARMYGRPTFTFGHCDAESLVVLLKRHVRPAQRPVVLTDGAFATTGRIPPLREYVSALRAYDGRLVVDESHAFGVVGANGRGAAEYCGVEGQVVSGATLSKAYCAQGAVVAGSPAALARVRRASPVGAACAGSPLSAAAAQASLAYMHDRAGIREELRAKADYLRARLRQMGLDVIETPAPIVTFTYGNRADMQALQRRAFERGIHVYHSKYIGAGSEGVIRCAVFRDHSPQDIDALIAVLR